MWWKLHDRNFNRFWLIHPCDGRMDRQTDRQTDGQTDGRNCRSIYALPAMLSRVKNCTPFPHPNWISSFKAPEEIRLWTIEIRCPILATGYDRRRTMWFCTLVTFVVFAADLKFSNRTRVVRRHTGRHKQRHTETCTYTNKVSWHYLVDLAVIFTTSAAQTSPKGSIGPVRECAQQL